ncbi:MAG: pantoate--beta-alanine ligase [Planctomycetota bacterium]|jgi:pantoate--beta-alanine ligase
MEGVKTIDAVRDLVKAARGKGRRIGFVPTMGALHSGHVSLIEAAVKNGNYVIVSIFVNPTQFRPGEDFEKYPRDLQADTVICEKAGVDVVFAPAAAEIYPAENVTWVNVEKLTENLCGRSRPGHFRGVTTVCAKLFNIIQPDFAYFGQKDAQQAIVIKRMAADLNMPLEIIICPTVRRPDGLAISSRNQYLAEKEEKDAALIYKSLLKCQDLTAKGVKDSQEIISRMRDILRQIPSVTIEYINIVDAETLENVQSVEGKVLAAVAVKVGSTRLIDNILLDADNQ